MLAVSGVCVLPGPAMGEDCPEPVKLQSAAALPATTAPDEQQDIQLEMDSFEATREGLWNLEGDVGIKQGDREIKTSDATYDPEKQTFSTRSGVTYSDPGMKVQGSSADFDPNGSVTFEGAQFELPAQPARGSAARIRANKDGELSLDAVRYTTCPLGNDDWILKASDIDISQKSGIGTGRNVRLDFKGIPILYTPFISFPVSDQRKTGFLFPTFGTSSRSGTEIGVPWYWNIAPEYDATLLPTWYSKRGARLDSELRYLSPFGRGTLTADYLPDDQEFGDSRLLAHFADQSEFSQHLRLNIDAANVSDNRWFEDFGLGPEGTSASYLNRSANLIYLDHTWFASLLAQNFQVIDSTIDDFDRPYTLLPQLAVHAHAPGQPFGLTLNFDGELSNFLRNDGVTGMRLDVAPELRMPLRGAGLYLEPAASWRYTAYDLDDTAPGADRSPRRSAPIFSLDGGIAFEKNWGEGGKRLQTFEPRALYLYVPYRNQDALPVFDTDEPDLNPVQLFRTNRFIGADRLSNANQVSIGFTSRLLDTATGQQFIAGTIGQAIYFDEPTVTLPGMPLDDTESSDIVAELELTTFKDWNVSMGVQWDPGDMRSEKGDINLQYRPEVDRVANLGYRFRRDNIEQVDGSVAWPIGDRWGAYARMVYSLEENTTLDQFAGLEYRSCCWRLRFVGRRYVSNRDGDVDTSFLVQLELNGLSSVGVGADAFLERSIRGYSINRPGESN
ncbi:LPS-assembly protein LptD [Povalibacter sp.]|uniref:LPS-assembly protein LptD n=1 Tax=Povalibacter sp. TaxID=1962978 RepID=UPI002F412223